MALKLDLTKSSDEVFYALLTETAGKTITAADVVGSNITEDASVVGSNTLITLSVVEGSTVAMGGPITRHYKRITLPEVMTAIGKDSTDLELTADITPWQGATAEATALVALNALLGTVLTVDEISLSNASLDTGVTPNTYSVDVSAINHYGLVGEVTFMVTDLEEHQALADIFPDASLDGLTPPTV